MDETIKTLLEEYQVRKTKRQKDTFIVWIKKEIEKMGYELNVDKVKSSRNLIVGDVKDSDVIFTAHYDTQPNAIIHIKTAFSNHLTYLLSQILAMIPLLVVFFGIEAIIVSLANSFPEYSNLFLILLMIWAFSLVAFAIQIMAGKANHHTANDNTSGVATLLKIMNDLPKEHREKVCFVFFDHEEVGLVGSKRFKKKYKADVKDKLLINFDCVADGETFIFVSKKAVFKSEYFPSLSNCSTVMSKPSDFRKASMTPYPSDQLWFKRGIGVVAAKRSKMFGYYIDNIHTKRDTVFQYENIIDLSKMMIDFVDSI